jgi:hypothetical protein
MQREKDWNSGRLEWWKIGIMEDWNHGRLEYRKLSGLDFAVVPKAIFQHSIIPLFQLHFASVLKCNEARDAFMRATKEIADGR